MIIAIYDPLDGTPVSDGATLDTVGHLIELNETGSVSVRYSTENIFYGLRLAVVKGQVSHRDVVFEYDGTRIALNEYGSAHDAPVEFCAFTSDLAYNVLKLAVAMRTRNMRNNARREELGT